MPSPATVRERRLRKTKAQLIDEIDTLEQRAAVIEAAYRSGAPMRAKASDRYLANQELAHPGRISERFEYDWHVPQAREASKWLVT